MIVVDRIEADRAVLEICGKTLDIPLSLLPAGAKEGDVLRLIVDPDRTNTELSEAAARLHRLRKRSTPGPGTFDL
ncbi:MAG: DUF3006 domain-containing protein [Myxococcales bacterium]|nr:DUF3006 domain-containing protein [Myxococcales bacterium]